MTVSTTSRKLRLLVVSSTYPRWLGDPEPGFVHELAKRLTETFDVTALGPHAPGAAVNEVLDGVRVVRYRYAPTRLETLVNDGGIVSNLRRNPWKWLLVPGFLLAQAWRTWRLIGALRPDVVHAHWLLPQGLIVALLGTFDGRVPPFVVTSHGADLFALRAQPLQALKRLVARRAAAITVVSAAMRDELVRISVTPNKISVQPMGVDLTERFTPDSAVERRRDELLFVGRLVPKKGCELLLRSVNTLKSLGMSEKVLVAGGGPDRVALEKLTRELVIEDRVTFLGPITNPELPKLMRECAAMIVPFVVAPDGDQEGLGLVAIEAMGCECPLIGTPLAEINEIIRDGKTAWIAPTPTPDALAQAIIHAVGDPGESRLRASRARQLALTHFDWSGVADRYRSVLQSMIQ